MSNYGTRYILSILKIWAVIYKNKNHNKLYLKIIIGSIHNIGIISKVCLNQCFFCCCTFFEVTILSINVLSNTWLSYLSDTYLPSPPLPHPNASRKWTKWLFQRVTTKQYWPFHSSYQAKLTLSESYYQTIVNIFSRVHIKQYWHFQRVTTKQQ